MGLLYDPQEYDFVDFCNDTMELENFLEFLHSLPKDTSLLEVCLWDDHVRDQCDGSVTYCRVEEGSSTWDDLRDRLITNVATRDERLYDLIAEEVCDTVGELIEAYDMGHSYETLEYQQRQ